MSRCSASSLFNLSLFVEPPFKIERFYLIRPVRRFVFMESAVFANVNSNSENDFDYSVLRKASFRGCKLPRSGFRFADVQNADFREGSFVRSFVDKC